ncbi:hypothetical protein [Haloferula sp.]|uniref:hypothetical protein n=1 Tax=Haloferula sp. TaxID=2497595 RepID=UPI0032A13793
MMLGTLAPLKAKAGTVEPLRGMYVDGAPVFVGHEQARKEFLQFVRVNRITYVLFYLRPSHVTKTGVELSDLINTLKSEYGVLQVGATTGAESQVIVDHNNRFSGKFDVINLEEEFWLVPKGPERVKAFGRYTGHLEKMNQIATGNDLMVEAYIGWVTKPQMAEIVARLDRLLLHTYVRRPQGSYGYGRTRFEMISELESDVEVMPIFSLEKTEANRKGGAVFLGQWMLDNSPKKSDYDFVAGFDLAESEFNANYQKAVAGPENLDINLVGHHYFTYSQIVNLPPTASNVAPALRHIVVEGEAVTPIEFIMSASGKHLQGVDWYQSGKGKIGSVEFNGEAKNAMTITETPPYAVAAIPYDRGLYGRDPLYAQEHMTWQVLAKNTLPTATAVSPKSLDVYLKPGDKITFVHEANDVDGNLFAADWYGRKYLHRSRITGKSARTSREIQFDEVGTFRVSVDLFDRAVYMPDNKIRQNKVRGSVQWTVHVGNEPQ